MTFKTQATFSRTITLACIMFSITMQGKPTELSKEIGPLAFSEVKAAGYVPGTEVNII